MSNKLNYPEYFTYLLLILYIIFYPIIILFGVINIICNIHIFMCKKSNKDKDNENDNYNNNDNDIDIIIETNTDMNIDKNINKNIDDSLDVDYIILNM